MSDDLIRINAAPAADWDAWTVENRLLDAFWNLQVSPEHRPEILRLFARMVIARPDSWDREAIRREGCALELSTKGCFCCGTAARRLYWHHVVQVQHGGSNTPRNLVALCHRCHAAVHPWLDPEREGGTFTGWHHISGMKPEDFDNE